MTGSEPKPPPGGQNPGGDASPSAMSRLPGKAEEAEVDALERQIDLSLRRAHDATQGRRPDRGRRRWLSRLLVTILVLALAATATLAIYLWRTTEEWMAEADRIEDIAGKLAAERDDLTAQLNQAQRDRDATDAQLRAVQDRLTALADEKAQTADERELARQVAGDVAEVASQLEVCVRGQEDLITALENIEQYDPDSVSEYARAVTEACNEALAGSEQIKQQLGIE